MGLSVDLNLRMNLHDRLCATWQIAPRAPKQFSERCCHSHLDWTWSARHIPTMVPIDPHFTQPTINSRGRTCAHDVPNQTMGLWKIHRIPRTFTIVRSADVCAWHGIVDESMNSVGPIRNQPQPRDTFIHVSRDAQHETRVSIAIHDVKKCRLREPLRH
jgi:hypothetical protein